MIHFIMLLMSSNGLAAESSLAGNQVTGVYWKKAWSEEFNSTDGGDEKSCYLTKAKCLNKEGAQPEDCPDTDALLKLNKCIWTVQAHTDLKSDGINTFSPSEISIANGELVLSSKVIAAPDGTTSFFSGSITTKPFEKTGFNFTYGRLEVRAWLPQGAGAKPVINLLPAKPLLEWPMDGEIVAIESSPDNQNQTISRFFSGERDTKTPLSKVVFGPSAESGSARDKTTKSEAEHFSKNLPGNSDDNSTKNFTDDWHVYAVEWSPLEIRYYVDQWQIGSVREGEFIQAMNADKTYRANIPNSEFYITISNRVAAYRNLAEKFRPNPAKYNTQKLHIDYVRLFANCSKNTDSKDCVENTLSPSCPNPCEGVGRFDGVGCLVSFAPETYKAKHSKGKFYFHPDKLGGGFFKITCPGGVEFVRGKGCVAGDVPAGHEGFAMNDESLGARFYVKSKCKR